MILVILLLNLFYYVFVIVLFILKVKLDKKYQKMFEEFSRLRKNHKSIKDNLSGELKKLKQEFTDFKSREPQVINLNAAEIVEKLTQNITEANQNNKQLIVHVRDDSVSQATPTTTTAASATTGNLADADGSSEMEKFKKSLPQLNSGQEVLVRWPDDGWYYLSVIKENLGNHYQYKIEDSLRDIEIVSRQDIISDEDNANDYFEVIKQSISKSNN